MFNRLIALIGEEKFSLIQEKKVLLIGVGGVGGYTLESLVRSGINNIDIVDYDMIDITNLNRQIITNQNNVGNSKVQEAVLRAKSINPDINVRCYEKCLDEANIDELLANNYDYVIDACDTVIVKYKLMELKNKYNYKLITCLGTAKKMDPSKLSITTIEKTNYDPLAKILRKMVRDNKLKGKFTVVSSTESPSDCEILGTVSFVPAVAGNYLASYVINDIVR